MINKADLNIAQVPVTAHRQTPVREESPDRVSLGSGGPAGDQNLVGRSRELSAPAAHSKVAVPEVTAPPEVTVPGAGPLPAGTGGATGFELGGDTWLTSDGKPGSHGVVLEREAGSVTSGYSAEQMGFLAGQEPPQSAGGVQDTFYHHIDWSGWSGKPPLEAGIGVLRGGHLSSGRAFSVDTWHGVLRGCREGTVTLVFSPDMPAKERANGIFQRSAGSGIWLNSDKHLEGVLYTGSSIPPELVEAVADLNQQRQDFGLPPVDLLPWKMFENAWKE